MNPALQAYNVMTSPISDATAQRSINLVIFTYFIIFQNQNKFSIGHIEHRGANGDLAGSDERILYKASRKCTVTGIDQHQINGLYIGQYATLTYTNHGYVSLVMNEYACYGKGPTINSAGQIEWHKNFVDDKSVKVGGKQCISTLDGYAFP